MTLVAVDIYCKDRSPIPAAIPDATVAVFDATGTTLLSQTTTDLDGLAALLLDDGGVAGFADYRLRFFKSEVAWPNNTAIRVLPSPATNAFDVSGEPRSAPVVADPRLCVAYGVFRDATGAPAPWTDLAFRPRFNPLLLEGSPVLSERAEVRTDAQGYVEIPLIRFGQYDVSVQGLEDITRTVSVPDAANVGIGDLLFAVVAGVSFSPAGPVAVAAGADAVITPTVVASDGRTLSGAANADVVWAVADPTVASIEVTAATLVVRGLRAGTTTITATRRDTTIVRIPNTGITGLPLTVVVT